MPDHGESSHHLGLSDDDMEAQSELGWEIIRTVRASTFLPNLNQTIQMQLGPRRRNP